jgi:hypothetical protein
LKGYLLIEYDFGTAPVIPVQFVIPVYRAILIFLSLFCQVQLLAFNHKLTLSEAKVFSF